jgi:hypothetical protein
MDEHHGGLHLVAVLSAGPGTPRMHLLHVGEQRFGSKGGWVHDVNAVLCALAGGRAIREPPCDAL